MSDMSEITGNAAAALLTIGMLQTRGMIDGGHMETDIPKTHWLLQEHRENGWVLVPEQVTEEAFGMMNHPLMGDVPPEIEADIRLLLRTEADSLAVWFGAKT